MTTHAVHRFRERVRPGLGWSAAEEELERLLEYAELQAAPPTWLADRQATSADAYLIIADIVLPLAKSRTGRDVWLVKTCLTRGGISEKTRDRRNSLRRARPQQSSRSRRNRRPYVAQPMRAEYA
jgi:hypothetical protein